MTQEAWACVPRPEDRRAIAVPLARRGAPALAQGGKRAMLGPSGWWVPKGCGAPGITAWVTASTPEPTPMSLPVGAQSGGAARGHRDGSGIALADSRIPVATMPRRAAEYRAVPHDPDGRGATPHGRRRRMNPASGSSGHTARVGRGIGPDRGLKRRCASAAPFSSAMYSSVRGRPADFVLSTRGGRDRPGTGDYSDCLFCASTRRSHSCAPSGRSRRSLPDVQPHRLLAVVCWTPAGTSRPA